MRAAQAQILTLLFCVELSLSSDYSRTVSYEKEIVIRCGIQDEGTASLLSNDKVDVWMINTHHADIRLEERLFNMLRDDLSECSVLHPCVESLVREFEQDMKNSSTLKDWHQSYHRYNETVQWYRDLVVNNPGMATFVESIGQSVEGRDQPAIRITTTNNPDYRFYFQCLTHAREWISGAVCMYVAEFFATGNNEEIENLLSQVELVFVPFVNPDGYEYTWTNDRLWLKNRQTNNGSTCRGVNIDRNYNDHWAQGGSSADPCSAIYHGPSAVSEPETKNTQNFFKSLKKVVGTIDWHSYGQTVLRPYASISKDPPDEAELKKVGDDIAYEIQGHGLNYTSQKAINNFHSTGSALDWFYSVNASCTNGGYRAASFMIVLRDTGKYGYLLPADQIIPTGKENIVSTIEFIENLMENPIKYPTNCV